jgi:ABC-type glycerol-3-phosphate transport system substrate-binding protein
MTSRSFLLRSLALALTLAQTACGPGALATGPAPTPTAATTLNVLTLCVEPARSVLNMMVDAYRTSRPDVAVKIECGSNYPGDVVTRTSSEDPPDVIWSLDLFAGAFGESDLAMDLETFADADASVDLDDVEPAVLALGRSRNSPGLYMLPASLETVQMFFNKTIWEASGAPLPTPDWTWDDLIAACKLIQEKQPKVRCLGIGTAGMPDAAWWGYVVPWIVGYGGQIASEDFKTSTFSAPRSLAGIQAYSDLWLKHEIAIPAFSGGRGDCFIRQTCAAVFFIPGKVREYRDRIRNFDWDVQRMPAHPVARATGMGVYGWSIGRRSRQPQAAWDLIRWLITPDGQREIARSYLGVPVLKSIEAEAIHRELAPPPANIGIWTEGSSNGLSPPSGYPLACGTLYAGLVADAYQGALRDVIRGDRTAAEAFAAADEVIQTCLDQSQ